MKQLSYPIKSVVDGELDRMTYFAAWIGDASNDETARKEGEGEDSELGNLLRAWDRASQGAREKFKARVGLVAVEPPAGDGLDIPECLRRAAP
jgi:hypothetical protein